MKVEVLASLINLVNGLDDTKYNDRENNIASEYIGKYCIIRTYAAGVHVGYIKQIDLKNLTIELTDSRRIWYWEGAFTLSAVANDGIKDGKLSAKTEKIIITQLVEIIPCSDKAKKQLENMSIYNA
jgi:hypothetical protein